jgi:hypothetical protein
MPEDLAPPEDRVRLERVEPGESALVAKRFEGGVRCAHRAAAFVRIGVVGPMRVLGGEFGVRAELVREVLV